MSQQGNANLQAGLSDATWLVRAYERMARPIIRLMVGRMPCDVAVNLFKQIFVQEARRHLEKEDPARRVTKSSLALLTGLDTRAISTMEELDTEHFTSGDLCPEAAILESWAQDNTYSDPDTGQPRRLPIYGRGLTFQTLVSRTVGRNVTCPTVLEKLTENGNVEIVDEAFVELRHRFYEAIQPSEKTYLESGSASLQQLGWSVTYNVAERKPGDPRWLQQARWSTRIDPKSLPVLREKMRALVEEHIKESESVLEEFEQPVLTQEHVSAGLGWYWWENPISRK